MAEPLAFDLAARAIGLLLEVSVRLRFMVAVRGRENFTRSPSTLVVFNHRRDADISIIANALFGGRAYLLPNRLKASFVAREDMFRPGFLTYYLEDIPWSIRKPFEWFNLAPVFAPLHAYPIRRTRERTLREVLQDSLAIFGNLPLECVLQPYWIRQFARLAPPGKPPRLVRNALHDRYMSLLKRHYGLVKLTRDHFEAMRPYEERVIESQLRRFVKLLEEGEVLQMAPEGGVSPDGRFNRVRIGLHVLLNRPAVEVRVLPVCVSYDFMTVGRPRVFLNIGPEMTGLKGLQPSETSERVAEAILAQATVTASHLAGLFLLETESAGRDLVTVRDLARFITVEARRWAGLGIYVDPRLFDRHALRRRLGDFFKYAVRSGLLEPLEDGNYRLVGHPLRARPGMETPEEAIKFAVNHLVSLSLMISPSRAHDAWLPRPGNGLEKLSRARAPVAAIRV